MRKKILFIPFILFMMLVFVFVVQLQKNTKGEKPTTLESVLIGKEVPIFKLEDLFEKNKVYDSSIFKGKPLLLNVWATWCPTCYSEHSFLNKLSKDDVKIIGLNYKDDRAKAIQWLKDLENPYDITLFDKNGMLGLDLGVYGAPETFFIDSNGIIRYRHVGDINQKNWNNTLESIYKSLK